MNFLDKLHSNMAGKLEIYWLGQAGFLIRTKEGKQIAIDPYFSDCVERLIPEEGLGFKRLMPPPCRPEDLELDILIISHEHNDHFDVDAIFSLVKEFTHVYTNTPVAESMREMGFDMSRVHVMEKGTLLECGIISILPVDCDHGELAPEALGMILDFGVTNVYYAGDTAWNMERLRVPMERKPEIAILPINGAFGNMDGVQAAQFAGRLGCKVCIPCHFWTFALHHGDPQQIIDAMKTEAPECSLVLLCQGEAYSVYR